MTTPLRICGKRGPAAGTKGIVGGPKALRRVHRPIGQGTLLAIARLIQRQQDFGAKLRRLLKYRVDQIRPQFLTARESAQALGTRELVQDEPHITERGGIGRHGSL